MYHIFLLSLSRPGLIIHAGDPDNIHSQSGRRFNPFDSPPKCCRSGSTSTSTPPIENLAIRSAQRHSEALLTEDRCKRSRKRIDAALATHQPPPIYLLTEYHASSNSSSSGLSPAPAIQSTALIFCTNDLVAAASRARRINAATLFSLEISRRVNTEARSTTRSRCGSGRGGMVFDDGSHIRPCSNFGRRVSVSTDRSMPIRRTGVVADRVFHRMRIARVHVSRARRSCATSRPFPPSSSSSFQPGTMFSLTRIHRQPIEHTEESFFENFRGIVE